MRANGVIEGDSVTLWFVVRGQLIDVVWLPSRNSVKSRCSLRREQMEHQNKSSGAMKRRQAKQTFVRTSKPTLARAFPFETCLLEWMHHWISSSYWLHFLYSTAARFPCQTLPSRQVHHFRWLAVVILAVASNVWSLIYQNPIARFSKLSKPVSGFTRVHSTSSHLVSSSQVNRSVWPLVFTTSACI